MQWDTHFHDEKMTDAVIGRLTHKGHIIQFVGESSRFRHRLQQGEPPAEGGKVDAG